jgi:hypothetical protein
MKVVHKLLAVVHKMEIVREAVFTQSIPDHEPIVGVIIGNQNSNGFSGHVSILLNALPAAIQ